MKGWMGYFGLSETYSVWLPIDRWLRRRIRMCYWRMWKHAKRRYLNLRKLGAKHNEAGGFARSSKGYWRVAKHLGYKAGLTNEWLANALSVRRVWPQNVSFCEGNSRISDGLIETSTRSFLKSLGLFEGPLYFVAIASFVLGQSAFNWTLW